MKNTSPAFTTPRLTLTPLSPADSPFILELVNTPGWLRFIGDRKVTDLDSADAYVRKCLENPNGKLWVAKRNGTQTPIGIISFLKRENLPQHDIGFAFLPQYSRQGYAYEAMSAALKHILPEYEGESILAITISENTNSIRLLEKSGFIHQKEIDMDNEILQLYAATKPELLKLIKIKNAL